ncbi:TetR/AcrR family transcriptional regulator [Frigoriflavimonas asaccharolytica]|uniref:AcrR family transcriptional regulator n=1 Tax=Frigoriflavimonas asaccharolytica TaxID=2735899 RepID=A0A8J8G5Y9_9FLAO|nr:TetR/AcrR family transcriptional regulator [Frigoriflavimonas asaccharolytica]NRS91340.1 AcrR family transcriptional regulator [Frigoriflavimonas asaccharolytica]
MNLDLSDRQLEILQASGKILMERGILGLTTKNLALEMKFSESALYRHFKDKESIISNLIKYLSSNINERFENIVNKNLSAEATLLELFKSQFYFFKTNPHFIVIVLSDGLIDNSENIKSEVLKLMQTNSKVYKTVVENGQNTGIFVTEISASDLVHAIIGSFRLQMLKWKLSNFSFDIEIEGMKTMKNILTLIKNKNG